MEPVKAPPSLRDVVEEDAEEMVGLLTEAWRSCGLDAEGAEVGEGMPTTAAIQAFSCM